MLKEAQSFAATISGFGTGDTIDATNFLFSGTPTFNFVENSANAGTLTLQDGSLTADILMTGKYSNSDFTLAPDYGTGTLVKVRLSRRRRSASIRPAASSGGVRPATATRAGLHERCANLHSFNHVLRIPSGPPGRLPALWRPARAEDGESMPNSVVGLRTVLAFAIAAAGLQPALARGGGGPPVSLMTRQYCTEMVVNKGITEIERFQQEVRKCVANPVIYPPTYK
jgi:hypothetical protein